MKFKFYLCLFLTVYSFNASSQIKILFDATKAESASNADWVIDADLWNLRYSGSTVTTGGSESNPQQFPTPAQSTITASTPETFWKGALSSWGIDCVKQGYQVETLPYNGQITYGSASNSQDLSNYKVFIICEPNIVFNSSEKEAILNFVKNGGGLFMVSDHTVSDRNSDGWDSPDIWNDFMTNNSVESNPFGITFDLKNISGASYNIANIPNDSVLHGIIGDVAEAEWFNGTTMTLLPSKNPSVSGKIYTTGSSNNGNTNVMFATARYGKGKVAAIGDSSPCDDGTGDTGDNSLYDGYWSDASGNHRPLLMNATIWLATSNTLSTSLNNFSYINKNINLYPSIVSNGILNVKNGTNGRLEFRLVDFTGRILITDTISSHMKTIDVTGLHSGSYYCHITGKNTDFSQIIFIYR